MAITRLKRKQRKKVKRTQARQRNLKVQNFKPVVKNVDIEKIKESFGTKPAAKKEKPAEG